VRILAVSGSLRAESYNTALARAAIELAPTGTEIELYEGLAWIPPYDGDDDGEDPPATVAMLRARIREADGLLVVTPEYNGSVPGVLKNAIDWASRPPRESALWGKTVAIAGATTGRYGAIWAQQDLRRVLGLAGARVVEGEVPVALAHERFDAEGQLVDPQIAERLRAHLDALVAESSGISLTAA
jgi:chromate reductase, NAD(P)H dehydrogenase (quinone)